jgi:uncharacterized protein YbaR (Trm112 family)
LREISKTQKLQVATIIIVGILIFYAIGIATDFFANPIFSMFFIISYDTAHNIVTPVAIVSAIIVIALSAWIIKKRKIGSPQTRDKPVIREINTPNKTPTIITPPINNHKITQYLESNKIEQENHIPQQPIIQPTKQSTTQTPIQPSTDINAAANTEAVINEGEITCPNCKKEFSKPVYKVDFITNKPMLVRVCPYCNHILDKQPKDNAEN